MKTTTCKPVYDTNVFRIVELAKAYEEIQQVAVNMNDWVSTLSSDESKIDLDDFDLTDEVQDVLMKKLDSIETQLNIHGYTMQEEPKEFKYHVNEVKVDE